MCRNIKTLFNFDPPATNAEIRASAVQYVRKLSGSSRPSKVNEAAFEFAVQQIELVSRDLLGSLVTHAPPRNRDDEAEKAKIRSARRFQNKMESPRTELS